MNNEERAEGFRRHFYWMSASFATVIFCGCSYVSMVPGMYPPDQLLLFSSATVAVLVALAVGLWRFRTAKAPLSKAPLFRWPLGPIIGAILVFEAIVCFIGISKVLPMVLR
jgi:hypothetical protein